MNDVHDMPDLRQLDLNQLVYLDAMLELRSVTNAAERIGITQSAMSHALRRLRDRLEDPLLVRIGAGMEPTPFAEQLKPRLRAALIELQNALIPSGPFEPAVETRTFSIASPDLFDVLVLPELIRAVRKEGPNLAIRVSSYGRKNLESGLAQGAIDLALVPVLADAQQPGSDGIMRRNLFRDGFKCFARAGHPALRDWGLDSWLESGHLLVSPSGRSTGLVDRALQKIGRSRDVALQVEGFGVAPRIVANSDLILTAPSSLARLTRPMGVVDLDAPVELPDHSITMVWHTRFGGDNGLRWLMDQLERAIEGRVPWDGES